MENDLISRKAAIDAVSYETFECYQARKDIRALPSIDRKGHWIDRIEEHGDRIGIYPWEVFKCSECGHLTAGNEFKFCPHCGADMRGEQND